MCLVKETACCYLHRETNQKNLQLPLALWSFISSSSSLFSRPAHNLIFCCLALYSWHQLVSAKQSKWSIQLLQNQIFSSGVGRTPKTDLKECKYWTQRQQVAKNRTPNERSCCSILSRCLSLLWFGNEFTHMNLKCNGMSVL